MVVSDPLLLGYVIQRMRSDRPVSRRISRRPPAEKIFGLAAIDFAKPPAEKNFGLAAGSATGLAVTTVICMVQKSRLYSSALYRKLQTNVTDRHIIEQCSTSE